jgi:putative phosphoribosyl transferase
MFTDRREAGRQLAQLLMRRRRHDPVVLALPRGGVLVGEEVARALGAPLDVVVARKLGAPRHPELGYGAVAERGGFYLDHALVRHLAITPSQIEAAVEAERSELVRRVRAYRGERPLPSVHGKTVVLVDDGLATGSTARAALRAIRGLHPAELVLAVPVLPADQLPHLRQEADAVEAVQAAEEFSSVSSFYADFPATSDAEVLAGLSRTARPASSPELQPVQIGSGGVMLHGDLTVPGGARGVVLFAHGSGSSRHSPRNRFVARRLQRAGFATLLLDLLTEEEEQLDAHSGDLRFNVEFLAERLLVATRWLQAHPALCGLPLGYFGASTGAGAALAAAAAMPSAVAAVVSRGGRPDLAGEERLAQVRAPTLLIVGARDEEVRALNQEADRQLGCTSHLTLVPQAGHLFEGPGELEAVADAAVSWFGRHLTRHSESSSNVGAS